MAASTRKLCGCPSIRLFKAVVNMRSYLHCCKKIHVPSMSKAYPLCVKAPVVAIRGRLNVTSTVQRGRLHAHVAGVRCQHFQQMTRTALNSSQCAALSSNTAFNRYVFPYQHCSWQRRTLFRCRILDAKNTFDKSESETSAVSNQQANNFSSRPGSNTGEEQMDDRVNCRNGKPEKKENIKTIPNLITTLRMASAPLLGYMVVSENFGLALGLFTFAGITDLLDGYIARNFPNQTSALGSVLDPLADKLLVTILTITLTTVGLIPLPLTGLIVLRDTSLIAGGFYIRYKSLPPPITLSRYFDISHATVSLAPTLISKVNTGLQLSLVACSLAAPVFGFVDHIALQALCWTTGATTFLSGADYFWSWKKYVTLLEKDQKEL